MSDTATIIERLKALTKDEGRLATLLRIEKGRRHLRESALCFVGSHNVAQLTWCPMFAVLKSRQNETSIFFRLYLENRVLSAHLLGKIGAPPLTDEAWLDIGSDVRLSEYEHVHRIRYEQKAPEREFRRQEQERQKKALEPVLAKYPALREEMTEALATAPAEFLEEERAEKYRKMRWHFEWREFVVVAEPDGLTDEFVYEFKVHKRRRFLADDLRNAHAQADLYGVYFNRPYKRVQILIREDNGTETTMLPVDPANADSLLGRFKTVVDTGNAPPQPAWKCRNCEFNEICPILKGSK